MYRKFSTIIDMKQPSGRLTIYELRFKGHPVLPQQILEVTHVNQYHIFTQSAEIRDVCCLEKKIDENQIDIRQSVHQTI